MALGEEVGDAYIEVHADTSPFSRDLERGLASGEKAEAESQRRRRLANSRFYEDMSEDRRAYFENEVKHLTDSNKKWTKWASGNERQVNRFRTAIRNSFGNLDDLDTDAFQRAVSSFLGDSEHLFTASGERSGDRYNRGVIGRLKGARNDFVNIIGVIGGGIEDAFSSAFDKVADLVGNGLASAGEKITDFAGGSGPLSKLGSGLTSMGDQVAGLAGKGGWVGLAVSVGVAIVSFEAFIALLGPLVAGLSSLLGIVTALASALGFALGGALLSLGPIIGAAVVGIGGFIDALVQMTDESGKTNLLKELTKQFNGFEDAVFKGLPTFDEFSDIFKQVFAALTPLIPLVQDSINAVVGWIKGLSSAVDGGAMKKAIGVFDDTWPGILKNLLDTFTSIFQGIFGVLRAISPIVEDVTGSIADTADQFSKWANSTEGQKTITSFFEKARDDAADLWGIIKNVGTIIGEVFGAGESTGKGFLDNLKQMTANWAEFLGTKQGQAALKQWFSDAKDLASQLKSVVSDLVHFLDQLDTPENRKAFTDMVGWIKGLVSVLQVANNFVQIFEEKMTSLARAEQGVIDWTKQTAAAISGFFGALPGEVSSLVSSIGSTISGFVSSIGSALGGAWDGLVSGLSDAWGEVVAFWNGTVMGFFHAITAPFVDFWSSFWSHLWKEISPQWDKVTAWWNRTVVPFFSSKITWAATRWTAFWGTITTGLSAGWSKVVSWWNSTVVARFNAWRTWAVTRWTSFWSTIGSGLSAGWAKVTGWWNSTVVGWFSSRRTAVATAWTGIWSHIGDGISAGWSKITGWWSGTAYPWFTSLPSKLGSIGGDIVGSILNGIINSFYKIPQWIGSQLSKLHFNIGGASIKIPGLARGGTVSGATHAVIGEAGPEAVVPLARNLNQVDPSVRWLSAIAQGKATPAMAAGGVAGGGTTIEAGAIQVISPYANPALVAEDVMDELAKRFR